MTGGHVYAVDSIITGVLVALVLAWPGTSFTPTADASLMAGEALLNHNLSTTFMTDLPTEILIAIFDFYAEQDAFAPGKLCKVCHRWRCIVNDLPKTWTHLCPKLPFSPTQWAKQAEIYFNHSNPLPIMIEADINQQDDLSFVTPLLPFLQNEHGRTQIRVRGRWAHCRFEPALPALSRMALVHRTPFNDVPHIVIGNNGKCRLWVVLPTLPDTLTDLPFEDVFVSNEDHSTPYEQKDIDGLLRVLAHCPHTRELQLSSHWEVPVGSDQDRIQTDALVCLPQLTHLTIVYESLDHIILSALSLPALTHLSIRHAPSRYSSSKRRWREERKKLLGQGLTQLLAQSPNMPLHTLQLCQVELPSKTFFHLFGLVPTLCVLDMDNCDISNATLETLATPGRLPKLDHLLLKRCNKLSANTILAAVALRSKGLRKVQITECPKFKPKHAQKMRLILGEVFVD